MKYIQFLELKLDGSVKEMLGSSGYCNIDNRLSLSNIILLAKNEAKKILRRPDGFRIIINSNSKLVDSDNNNNNTIYEELFERKV